MLKFYNLPETLTKTSQRAQSHHQFKFLPLTGEKDRANTEKILAERDVSSKNANHIYIYIAY